MKQLEAMTIHSIKTIRYKVSMLNKMLKLLKVLTCKLSTCEVFACGEKRVLSIKLFLFFHIYYEAWYFNACVDNKEGRSGTIRNEMGFSGFCLV